MGQSIESRKASGEYEVGYGKPPRHSRWKKGESGNPKGRPRQSKTLFGYIRKIANEKVTVREGDEIKEMTRSEALVRVLSQKAMKGDQKAMTSYLRLMRDAGLASEDSDEPQCGLIAVPLRSETLEEWKERHKHVKAPGRQSHEEPERQNAATTVSEKRKDSLDDGEN